MKTLIILKGALHRPESSAHHLILTFEEVKAQLKSGRFFKYLFRFREAQLHTYHMEFVPKLFLSAVLTRLLGFHAWIQDEENHRQKITLFLLAILLGRLLRDWAGKPSAIRHIRKEILSLSAPLPHSPSHGLLVNSHGTPVYLRTDAAIGTRSGGSIGHIAGVLNSLDHFFPKPIFITSDFIPTVHDDIPTHIIYPDHRFWDFVELPSFFFNKTFEEKAKQILAGKSLSFIYQRYSLNNFSGLKLARHFQVPFVLEYNGSEVWISRNWGKPLKYERLSEDIERLNLSAADVVVVVSQPMKEELVARGISPEKILANPNGVNPEKYSPQIDGTAVRTRYHLEGKTVIGFIGTFGPWHGAEVLAEAFGRLLHQYPEYRQHVRLLMIGDGITMPQVKKNLADFKVTDLAVLTGVIPQKDGPQHLAACDLLASPHVPNPDGSKFFGSPTKLFEYMAMGKGIVASDLDQIGEILTHGRTAWMVKPGDIDSLVLGMKALIDNQELRDQLGRSARQEVLAKYTWKNHTQNIINKLLEVTGKS